MTAARPVESRLSIVVRGAFNPSIFQPAWFAQEQIIRSAEADAAAVEIIHSDVAIFQAEWFRFEATRDRLAIHTSRESHFEAVRDLARSVLELLRHMPTRVVGVNHDVILDLNSRDAFDGFGWRLVPPENWSPVIERPGMVTLVEQGMRTDGLDGYVRVKVEPILDGGTRALVEVNDHFQVSEANAPSSTVRIANLLEEQWEVISSRADEVLSHVIGSDEVIADTLPISQTAGLRAVWTQRNQSCCRNKPEWLSKGLPRIRHLKSRLRRRSCSRRRWCFRPVRRPPGPNRSSTLSRSGKVTSSKSPATYSLQW
jgi:hypothetical protein